MPRYFLHVCNGMGFVEDSEGVQLPSLSAARQKAIEGLRDLMAGEMKEGQLNQASFVEIADKADRLLAIVSFSDAVKVSSSDCQPSTTKRSRLREATPLAD